MDNTTKPAEKPREAPKLVGPNDFRPAKDFKHSFKSKTPVTRVTGLLHLQDDKGKVHTGYYQEYTTDVTAPHIDKKKGDGVYHNTDGTVLTNVKAVKEL